MFLKHLLIPALYTVFIILNAMINYSSGSLIFRIGTDCNVPLHVMHGCINIDFL